MQGLMFDSQLLLHSLLWRTERLFADKQIVTRVGPGEYHRYTYRDFGKRTRRLGDALTTLGVAPGDRIGTLAWNHYRHLETYSGSPASRRSCTRSTSASPPRSRSSRSTRPRTGS